MVLFHSFAIAAFGVSITTLILFNRRDTRLPADGRATKLMFIGFALSMLEAFSGWMSCQALDQANAHLLGNSFSDGAAIIMYAAAMIVFVTAGTRALHDSLMRDANMTFIK